MASHRDFVDYVAEQLREAGVIRAKRMFGEYGLYCDGIFFAVICDDQLFVKRTPQGEEAFPNLPKAPPYAGAKDYILVEDVDDRETMAALVRLTCLALQLPPFVRQYGTLNDKRGVLLSRTPVSRGFPATAKGLRQSAAGPLRVEKPRLNRIVLCRGGGARGGIRPPRMESNAPEDLRGKASGKRSEDFSAAVRRKSNGILKGCRKSPRTFSTA